MIAQLMFLYVRLSSDLPKVLGACDAMAWHSITNKDYRAALAHADRWASLAPASRDAVRTRACALHNLMFTGYLNKAPMSEMVDISGKLVAAAEQVVQAFPDPECSDWIMVIRAYWETDKGKKAIDLATTIMDGGHAQSVKNHACYYRGLACATMRDPKGLRTCLAYLRKHGEPNSPPYVADLRGALARLVR
jgi:DNA-binding SARP family transcriptional activator